MRHRTTDELLAGLDTVRRSPADHGTVELLVRRPAVDEREVVDEAELDERVGMLGDTWSSRRSTRTADGSPHPGMQLTLVNARAAALFAAEPERRALLGDQVHVDLDLGVANLPPGTRLALGEAVVEVTDQPHTGCAKFTQRFGLDALHLLSSPDGEALRLRGINARVVVGGRVRRGDRVLKLQAPSPRVPAAAGTDGGFARNGA